MWIILKMNNEEFERKEFEKKLRGVRNNKLKKKLGEKCVYCKCENILTLTIDHKKALSRGGEDIDENKQVTCFICNQLKDVMSDKEFKEYMKALGILKDLNKIRMTFNTQGQPSILFNEKGYPQTIKEMEEKNGNENKNPVEQREEIKTAQ